MLGRVYTQRRMHLHQPFPSSFAVKSLKSHRTEILPWRCPGWVCRGKRMCIIGQVAHTSSVTRLHNPNFCNPSAASLASSFFLDRRFAFFNADFERPGSMAAPGGALLPDCCPGAAFNWPGRILPPLSFRSRARLKLAAHNRRRALMTWVLSPLRSAGQKHFKHARGAGVTRQLAYCTLGGLWIVTQVGGHVAAGP